MRVQQKLRNARRRYSEEGVGGIFSAIHNRLPDAFQPQGIYRRLFPERFKGSHELSFWKQYQATHARDNYWYRQWFTTHFGLSPSWYAGKRILDIGCGPLGSLEWADDALERVGLDSLAKKYQRLGASQHKMDYVAAPSERIPFEDGHFDVVSSFNSLDHVTDVAQTLAEITRVLKSEGLFLLITEVNHDPTPTEPQTFGWDIVERFEPAFQLLEKHQYEKSRVGVYQSITADNLFNYANLTKRPGVVDAKFRKR